MGWRVRPPTRTAPAPCCLFAGRQGGAAPGGGERASGGGARAAGRRGRGRRPRQGTLSLAIAPRRRAIACFTPDPCMQARTLARARVCRLCGLRRGPRWPFLFISRGSALCRTSGLRCCGRRTWVRRRSSALSPPLEPTCKPLPWCVSPVSLPRLCTLFCPQARAEPSAAAAAAAAGWQHAAPPGDHDGKHYWHPAARQLQGRRQRPQQGLNCRLSRH